MKKLLLGAAVIMIGLPSVGWAATEAEKVEALKMQVKAAKVQAAVVGGELSAIAKHLQDPAADRDRFFQRQRRILLQSGSTRAHI